MILPHARNCNVVAGVSLCIASLLAGCGPDAIVSPPLAESKSVSSAPSYELRITVDSNGTPIRVRAVRTRNRLGAFAAVSDASEGARLSAPPLAAARLANELSRYSDRFTTKYYQGSKEKAPSVPRVGGPRSSRSDAGPVAIGGFRSQMSGDRIDDWEIQYPIAWESEDSWATLYGETGAEAVQDAIVTGATAAINEEIAVGTDLINDTLTLYDTLTYAGGVPYSLRAPQESQTSTLAKVGFSFQMMAEEEEDGPCDPQLRDYQEALAGEVLAFAGMVGAALSPGVGWAGFSLVYAGWVYVDNIAENRRGRLNLCRVNTFVFYVRQPG